MPSVIVFGATGFIGVPFSRALKKAHPDWPITAYVRSTKPAEELKSYLSADRIEVGEFSDSEKIKALSKQHDIAVNAGNSFTGEPINAIIAGLKERPSGSKGKLIHVSGTGNFIDFGTTGEFNEKSKVWNDDNEEDIKAITKDMFNGQSDVPVLEAGKDGAIDTYIVCVGPTYGGASFGYKSLGVGYSIIIGNTKALGYAPYVNNGTALVSVTHIQDAVPFLVKIADIAASGPAQGSAYSRFYLIITESVAWKDLALEASKALKAKGLDIEAKSVSLDEAGQGEVKYLIGANMLVKGDRAAKMGYKPSQPSILTQIHEDMKEVTM